MPYDPQIHHRRSIRLKGYDYSSQGAYFVTLVCQYRDCIFGKILDGRIGFSKVGEIAQREWRRIERNFLFARIDEFVIMPDHLHGIIWILPFTGEASTSGNQSGCDQGKGSILGNTHNNRIVDASPKPLNGTQPNSLGAIIQNFKSVSTRKINHASGSPGTKIWQREPYEHIIRGEPELARIRRYIHDNPLHWEQDQQHH